MNEGYQVDSAASVADGVRMGSGRQYDLALTDLKLPDGTGLDVLRWFTEQMPDAPVIMLTAFGTVESAVAAMKLGATDYLGKPLDSPDVGGREVREVYASAHCCLRYLRARASAASGLSVNFDSIFSQPE